MRIFSTNFGSKILARCGFVEGVYNMEEHMHQFAEIVYCAEGSMELTVEGKREVMKAGNLAIIAPFRTHSFYTPKYVKRWICVFSDNFIHSSVTKEEFFASSESCVFEPDKSLMPFLCDRLPNNNEQIVEINKNDERLISLIVTAIYEDYLRKVKLIPSDNNNAISKILLYTSEHFKENLTLSSIGAALGYSPKYVSNCIAKIKNFNLPRLVNSFRTDYAKSLLINTDTNVIDIGLACGYKSEKSFHRAFRNISNTTPAEYRRQKRGFSKSNKNE